MSKFIKVLWVEEETTNQVSERRAYIEASLDYDVTVVESYEAGLKEIQNHDKYNIIIMDIRIPYGNSMQGNSSATNLETHENRYGVDLILDLYALKAESINGLMIYTNESWRHIRNDFAVITQNIERCYRHKNDCRSNEDFDAFIRHLLE